jgi:hypothetical protein
MSDRAKNTFKTSSVFFHFFCSTAIDFFSDDVNEGSFSYGDELARDDSKFVEEEFICNG